MAYVYGLVCPESNEIRYVGVTIQDLQIRFKQHLSHARRNKERYTYKDRWIRKLDALGKAEDIGIHIIETVDEQNMFEIEIFWITEYRKTHKLTNTSEGGDCNRMVGENHPCFGRQWDEERRKAFSKKRMGENNPVFGMKLPQSKEHREKISRNLRQSSKLKEARQDPKYRQLMKSLNSHPVLLLDLDGNVVKEFNSCREIASEFGLTYAAVKNAKRFKAIFQKKYRIVDKDDETL